MSTYLFTFRPPAEYAPSAATFDTWSRWQLELGVRLRDRGNPAFRATAVGNTGSGTSLGGYSLVRAGSLAQAAELARQCPMLEAGGGVEIAELSAHDDRFDAWLDQQATPQALAAEVSVHIAAPPTQVFPYLVEPARYVQWQGCEAQLAPVAGGIFRIHMADGFKAAGTFLKVVPPRRLVFTWGFADADAAQRTKLEPSQAARADAMPAGSTRVTIVLEPEAGGTRLTLRHEDLPNAVLRDGHQTAWEAYLPRLAACVEGRDPGPDPHA